MAFVIGIVVALLVVFLLAFITIKKPVFGEVIIALAVIMVVTAVFFYFQLDKRTEKKKNLIPLNQIEISNISHRLAYGNYYKLSADLKNNSEKYRLQSIVLKLSFYHCPAAQISDMSQCKLMDEKNHSIDTRIAAQQSSAIESYFLLDNESVLAIIDEKGFINWKIELLNGNAR